MLKVLWRKKNHQDKSATKRKRRLYSQHDFRINSSRFYSRHYSHCSINFAVQPIPPQTTLIYCEEVVALLSDNCKFHNTNKASANLLAAYYITTTTVAITCCLRTIISYHIQSFVTIGNKNIGAL